MKKNKIWLLVVLAVIVICSGGYYLWTSGSVSADFTGTEPVRFYINKDCATYNWVQTTNRYNTQVGKTFCFSINWPKTDFKQISAPVVGYQDYWGGEKISYRITGSGDTGYAFEVKTLQEGRSTFLFTFGNEARLFMITAKNPVSTPTPGASVRPSTTPTVNPENIVIQLSSNGPLKALPDGTGQIEIGQGGEVGIGLSWYYRDPATGKSVDGKPDVLPVWKAGPNVGITTIDGNIIDQTGKRALIFPIGVGNSYVTVNVGGKEKRIEIIQPSTKAKTQVSLWAGGTWYPASSLGWKEVIKVGETVKLKGAWTPVSGQTPNWSTSNSAVAAASVSSSATDGITLDIVGKSKGKAEINLSYNGEPYVYLIVVE